MTDIPRLTEVRWPVVDDHEQLERDVRDIRVDMCVGAIVLSGWFPSMQEGEQPDHEAIVGQVDAIHATVARAFDSKPLPRASTFVPHVSAETPWHIDIGPTTRPEEIPQLRLWVAHRGEVEVRVARLGTPLLEFNGAVMGVSDEEVIEKAHAYPASFRAVAGDGVLFVGYTKFDGSFAGNHTYHHFRAISDRAAQGIDLLIDPSEVRVG